MARTFGYGPAGLPVQQIGVLGEHDLCSSCAHQLRVTGPLGHLTSRRV